MQTFINVKAKKWWGLGIAYIDKNDEVCSIKIKLNVKPLKTRKSWKRRVFE